MVKPEDEFGRDKHRIDGRTIYCLRCKREQSASYRKANPEKARAATRAWGAANVERRARYDAERWISNKPELSDRHRRWRENNREVARERNKRHRSTPYGRVANSFRARVYGVLKGHKRGRRTFEYLGYSPEQLIAHLERCFSKGMSWTNMGEWHIDHIVPLSSFTFSSPDDAQFKAAWALSNLRPLWADENLAKGGRRLTLV